MNVNVTAITLHNGEQVDAILKEATTQADAWARNDDEWPSYFAAAVSLLGARHVIETHPQPLALGTHNIIGGRM